MRVGDVDFVEKLVQRPGMRDWGSSVHEDDESSFASDEVDEELEESIYDKGLWQGLA